MSLRMSNPMIGLALGVTALLGCGKEPSAVPGARAPAPPADATPVPSQTLPQGHPAIGQPSGPRALKPSGIASQAELDKVMVPLKDPEVRARFEDGFRRCFTSDQSQRDYAGAAQAMNDVLAKVPEFAPAYRVLAYTKLNTGDMQGSTDMYRKAIAIDPNYGEAQYALAFMLTQLDPVEGRKHFEKAMALGVPDERDLRSRFYPTAGS